MSDSDYEDVKHELSKIDNGYHKVAIVPPANSFGLVAISPEVRDYAVTLANSGLCPQSYKNKPDDIIIAAQYGHEIGLNFMQSLQSVAVINGRPSIYGDAALALVKRSSTYEYVVEEFDESDRNNVIALCRCKRRGEQDEHVYTFSYNDARTAKLWGKAGPWSQYPKRMAQMRARSFALRSVWPDVLGGLILSEEAQDYQLRDVTPPDAAGNAGTAPRSKTESIFERLKLRNSAINATLIETEPASEIEHNAIEVPEEVQTAPALDVMDLYAQIAKAKTQEDLRPLMDIIASLEPEPREAVGTAWKAKLAELRK